MLANIAEISTTWISPERDEYSFYRMREGTIATIDAGACIRCMFKDTHGDEDDFEVTLQCSPKGIVLIVDYYGSPLRLAFETYKSEGASILVHESPQHVVFMKIETCR